MEQDKFDILGPIMTDIGLELAKIVGGDPNGVFLYAEIGEGWVEPSVFKDEGDVVRYYNPKDSNLSDLLWDAWYAEPSEEKIMRWSVLEYDVKDRKFTASYKYPEEVDVEIFDVYGERREAALRARYGDKPVIYPPIPEGAVEWKP
jgi:hypothetical protein